MSVLHHKKSKHTWKTSCPQGNLKSLKKSINSFQVFFFYYFYFFFKPIALIFIMIQFSPRNFGCPKTFWSVSLPIPQKETRENKLWTARRSRQHPNLWYQWHVDCLPVVSHFPVEIHYVKTRECSDNEAPEIYKWLLRHAGVYAGRSRWRLWTLGHKWLFCKFSETFLEFACLCLVR